jgi:hypothetical protein
MVPSIEVDTFILDTCFVLTEWSMAFTNISSKIFKRAGMYVICFWIPLTKKVSIDVPASSSFDLTETEDDILVQIATFYLENVLNSYTIL